jgi:hypothetical protein
MDFIDEANKSGKPCAIIANKEGKLYCKTHEQSLLYIYIRNGKLGCRCQVGEDMTPKSKLVMLVY